MVINAADGQPPRISFGWISESFNLFLRDAGVWVASGVIYVVSVFAVSILIDVVSIMVFGAQSMQFGTTGAPSLPEALRFLFSALISIPLHALFNAGFYKMANKSVRGVPLHFGDLFSGYTRIWPFILFSFITGVLYICGLLALIIGIFFMLAFLYPAGALIADGEEIGGALSKSFNAIRYDVLNAMVMTFVVWLLVLLTAPFCLLPLFMTVPMIFIISALAYRDMIGMPAGPPATQVSDFGSGDAGGAWPPAPGQR